MNETSFKPIFLMIYILLQREKKTHDIENEYFPIFKGGLVHLSHV